MALRGRGARLVLISPYTSIPAVASEVVPWAPTRLLVRDRFDTLAKAPGIQVPVLIVHGTEDEVVPYRMGEALSRAFPHARLRPVAGAHHNDVADPEVVLAEIAAFARVGPTGSP
jgi:pimeloyl-ACP methyl ester carboxylesterase